ncbi:SMI1/KNR4 family protein [Actinophytocola sp.]|uniref:SMI1/KNR4 family protein n=1 Tax=Actinophytocola sp. TaxID=1872138 RepID=UPI002D3386D5|nr:SMI1/KNR4 family protein [Actinophytocola sp.]HYQ62613.1 SMI1/KNR4 family protein [Actinophytocola sp.]
MTGVDELLTLVEFGGRVARDHFDWKVMEKSIGLRLPSAYKELVEVLPPGHFQDFVRVTRPGDMGGSRDEFLGYYAHRLEDMRAWRTGESDRFPLPIFPEPGGLLPWGRSKQGDLFFWLTDGENPEDWPVVAAEREFAYWRAFDGGLVDLLVEVVTGRFDTRPFGVIPRAGAPRFQAVEPPGPPPPSTESFWIERSHGGGSPKSEFTELASIIGPARPEMSTLDWKSIERQFGFGLPSDYKTFIDTYGPGQFGDITVTSPVSGRNDSLNRLIEKIHAEASANPRRRPEQHPPIHPEAEGMIPWGETHDGWACCWAPSTANPDDWGIVRLAPARITCQYSPDLSVSAFLVKYATPGQIGLFLGREEDPPDPMTFTPR